MNSFLTGKTLQVLAFCHTLFSHKKLTLVENVLVLCPKTTILNWVNQFKIWLAKTNEQTPVKCFALTE